MVFSNHFTTGPGRPWRGVAARAGRLFAGACLHAALVLNATGAAGQSLRVATFNVSLNRNSAGRLIADLSTPNNLQARQVAEVLQRVRPDVVLLNEFDFDAAGDAARLFQDNYLSARQDTTGSGSPPAAILYPYRFSAPSNTGVSSGTDFDGDGSIDDFGFGNFPGQYGMVVYSRYPIDAAAARTFQTFLWGAMPGNRIPANYTQDGIDAARLSSKSHWDLPIDVSGRRLHVLASHPTPPVFDDPVFDQNGRRNADEIRFWADYVDPAASSYIRDDNGIGGGLAADQSFVILGDMNSDPLDGDSLPGAAMQLLDSPRVNATVRPASAGGTEDSAIEGGVNNRHLGDPALDTADFGFPGNLRVDYVLPSTDLAVRSSGVFWPTTADPLSALASGTIPSDHRLVYVDVTFVPEPASATLLVIGLLILARKRRVRGRR